MRKAITRNQKFAGGGCYFLAVASLALTLAAFGCTTNRYPGNGQPTGVTPSYGAPNQAVTPGSSSGTAGVPPMASSYRGVTRVNTDALALLAAEQGFRGRILGPANPSGVQVGVPGHETGQFVNPALASNPISTVNSTIYSTGAEAIVGEAAGVSAATTGGAVAATAPLASGGATSVGATPATATPAAVATASPAPLTVSGATSVGATPATVSPVATTATMLSGTTSRAITLSTSATKSSATKSSATGSSPIRIQNGTTGQVVVTNMSAVPSTKSAKP